MSRAGVVLKRIGRLLRFALICAVFTVCVFFLWRVFSTGTPKEMKTLTPTPELKTLYEEKGKNIYMFSQNYDEITRSEKASGYFAVPQAVFIPEANQAQIVFRYNNSTLTSVASDMGLDSPLERGKEHFDVSLVFFIDLTPEDREDNYDKSSENYRTVRFNPTSSQSTKTTLYNFYKYTFDFDIGEEGIALSEMLESGEIIAVHTEVYYKDGLDYSQEPYGAICVYDDRFKKTDVKLSGRDAKALKAD